jgi:hypothetical protein
LAAQGADTRHLPSSVNHPLLSQPGALPQAGLPFPSSRLLPQQSLLSSQEPWISSSDPHPRTSTRTLQGLDPTDAHGSVGRSSLLLNDPAAAAAAYARPQRKPSNRDEFDGPHQLLNLPSPRTIAAQDQPLPSLPVSLSVEEQGDIFSRLNEVLSRCAFDFVAKYQFPIPVEPEKRLVLSPQDREWAEWVYLLKRLATKRRIPARVLHDNQIKHLVTVLENSLEAPFAATHQSRPLKDDRYVLQFISAGIQVAKILQDAGAMKHLDRLYIQTASCIQDRRWTGLPI